MNGWLLLLTEAATSKDDGRRRYWRWLDGDANGELDVWGKKMMRSPVGVLQILKQGWKIEEASSETGKKDVFFSTRKTGKLNKSNTNQSAGEGSQTKKLPLRRKKKEAEEEEGEGGGIKAANLIRRTH